MISKRQVSTVGLLILILQPEVEGWADVTRITSELNSYWVEEDRVRTERTGEIYQ